VFTNGECIGIIYPPHAAAIAFKTNTANTQLKTPKQQTSAVAVAQIFSLQTGELLEEKEYDFEPNILSATVTPLTDGSALLFFLPVFHFVFFPFLLTFLSLLFSFSVWIHTFDDSQRLQKFNLHPPSSVSKWRISRMKDKSDSNAFPSARKLAERYPLPEMTTTTTTTTTTSVSTSQSVTDSVDINVAIMCILGRLHQVCFASRLPLVLSSHFPPSSFICVGC
jgi:hypothetical protein